MEDKGLFQDKYCNIMETALLSSGITMQRLNETMPMIFLDLKRYKRFHYCIVLRFSSYTFGYGTAKSETI